MDPYPNTKRELSAKIDTIDQLTNELSQLRQTGMQVPEYVEPRIRNLIDEAEKALQSINDVNKAVSDNPSRFGISEEELTSRKNFANLVRQRLNNDINILNTKPAATKTPSSSASDRQEQIRRMKVADNQRFIDDVMAQQQQQLQEGDQQLDIALGVAHGINQVANQLGNALTEDQERLKDLDSQMDRAQTQMDRLIEKTKKLLNEPKTWMWAGCIVLTIIVIILIIWVFLF